MTQTKFASDRYDAEQDMDIIKLAVAEHNMEKVKDPNAGTLAEFLKTKDWCEDAMENKDNKSVEVTTKEGKHYDVEDDGSVSILTECEDEKPGELTGTGTEENPFKIESIEDLVAFSFMCGGTNEKLAELGLKKNQFNDKYVTLERTLNFESNLSYENPTRINYGDLNNDGTIEDIKTELTKEDEGCIGFTPVNGFQGMFEGKGNTIRNIYINYTSNAGLFSGAWPKAIKNLSISGTIISKGPAAGFAANGCNGEISNCVNYANITGTSMAGGFIGWDSAKSSTVSNCVNYGEITYIPTAISYGGAGGIFGWTPSGTIDNCINYGKVNEGGGFVGCSGGTTITNCTNYGEATAGMISWVRTGLNTILNCSNYGNCVSGLVSGFSGAAWNDNSLHLVIKNSYNVGTVSEAGILGSQGNLCEKTVLDIDNCYNAGNSGYAIVKSITDDQTRVTSNITNTYYEESKSTNVGVEMEGIKPEIIKGNPDFVKKLNENVGTNEGWKRWKMGDNGYPTFE